MGRFLMSRFTIYLIFAVVVIISLTGCGNSVYSGTSKTGFAHFPKNNPISAEKALALAMPYIDLSYTMRGGHRAATYNQMTEPPLECVILDGAYYYVTKDNYPSKVTTFYMNYAVKVDKKTGEVIKP